MRVEAAASLDNQGYRPRSGVAEAQAIRVCSANHAAGSAAEMAAA